MNDANIHTPPTLTAQLLHVLSRATAAVSGDWLTPREVFAQASGIVDIIRGKAAKAKITLHRLQGNVSVLEGSGGNIAVLTG